jgi:hypothetical protein
MQFVPSTTDRILWKSVLALIISFTSLLVFSQPTERQLKKFSPVLQKNWKERSQRRTADFMIAVKDFSTFKSKVAENPHIQIAYEYKQTNVFLIKTTWDDLLQTILPQDDVLFVDEKRAPKEELAVSNLDLSTDKVNVIFRKFPAYNGNNMVVSVKENAPDSTDIDFRGRYLSTDLTSNIFSTHATDMATIIGGAGNTYYEGKGVAWGSTLSSSSFAVLLPDSDAAYKKYGITVQNHSYGTGIENFYGADAAAYDASVIVRPSLLHVFSAGNSGAETDTIGTYAGVSGFANITGSFKMAKNILTVGHTDSVGNILPASSRGPAYDGRIRPDLVAFAEDGSSGAAAIVSGIALVLQQVYKELHGSIPSSDLVKAVLLNSADDVGSKGIDFTSGYGRANAYKAMLEIINNQYFNGSIGNGVSDSTNLTVPPNVKNLKVTLVWNDPPADPNARKALVNDLDLELTLPATSQLWQPWVLSDFPDMDSLNSLPVRKRDSLNNIEQISLDDPAAGNYIIKVKGYDISSSSQSYFIAYQFDTLDRFAWYYPLGHDNIFNERSNILRWESTYSNATGSLEYSLDNGLTWQKIDSAVDLTKGYFKWTPPDSFATAMLRMSFASQAFVSDTFSISKRFDVNVGFNCPDSFMLYWPKNPGVNAYQLYDLGNQYLQPLIITADTAIILDKAAHSSLYYAVAPLINAKTGVRSYAYNYTNQGVGCYIETFFAQLAGNVAQLELELGTSFNIKSITWQKLTPSGYTSLKTITGIQGTSFSYSDVTVVLGLNTYRVKVELLSGQVIYTETTFVYFNEVPYFIYPNPVSQYQDATLINNDPEIVQLQVFNSIGEKLFEKTLNDFSNSIPTGKLSKGVYYLRIIKSNRLRTTLKLVVY